MLLSEERPRQIPRVIVCLQLAEQGDQRRRRRHDCPALDGMHCRPGGRLHSAGREVSMEPQGAEMISESHGYRLWR